MTSNLKILECKQCKKVVPYYCLECTLKELMSYYRRQKNKPLTNKQNKIMYLYQKCGLQCSVAKELGISPSAVSQQMHLIAKKLGTKATWRYD